MLAAALLLFALDGGEQTNCVALINFESYAFVTCINFCIIRTSGNALETTGLLNKFINAPINCQLTGTGQVAQSLLVWS